MSFTEVSPVEADKELPELALPDIQLNQDSSPNPVADTDVIDRCY